MQLLFRISSTSPWEILTRCLKKKKSVNISALLNYVCFDHRTNHSSFHLPLFPYINPLQLQKGWSKATQFPEEGMSVQGVCIFKPKFAQIQRNDRWVQCSIFSCQTRFYSTSQLLWLRSMICQRSKAESGAWKSHNPAGSQISLDHTSPLGQIPPHFHQSLLSQSKWLSWKS